MDDLISRQAAICVISEYADRLQMVNWEENPGVPYKAHALNWAINTIRDLPSAERRGRWVIRDDPRTEWYEITCSECGENVTSTAPCIGFFPVAKVTWDYCPNCGARMEE